MGILGIIVVASLGVGTLIGMQIAGGGDTAETPADSTNDQQSTSTPDGTTGNEAANNGTAANGTQANGTDRETAIPAREFSESAVADYVAKFVNEERAEQGVQRLTLGGATSAEVKAMAKNHSARMASAGTVAHQVNDGPKTHQRYRQADLFERCWYRANEGSYISEPDEAFEAVGSSVAGQVYQENGNSTFNADERAVARDIAEDWLASDTYRERLLEEEPSRLGVGVVVTDKGAVYATANVCA